MLKQLTFSVLPLLNFALLRFTLLSAWLSDSLRYYRPHCVNGATNSAHALSKLKQGGLYADYYQKSKPFARPPVPVKKLLQS